jgi:hypothetical protein
VENSLRNARRSNRIDELWQAGQRCSDLAKHASRVVSQLLSSDSPQSQGMLPVIPSVALASSRDHNHQTHMHMRYAHAQ